MERAEFATEPDPARLHRAHRLQESDAPQALKEFTELANLGSLMSMVYLGWASEKGMGTNVDLPRAASWYRRAMEGGSAEGAFRFGLLCQKEKKFSDAENAFDFGVSKGHMPSMYRLGLMYAKGIGVQTDTSRARNLFEAASASGHVYAKRSLASLLLRGDFGPVQIFRGLWLLGFGFINGLTVVVRDPTSDRLA